MENKDGNIHPGSNKYWHLTSQRAIKELQIKIAAMEQIMNSAQRSDYNKTVKALLENDREYNHIKAEETSYRSAIDGLPFLDVPKIPG